MTTIIKCFSVAILIILHLNIWITAQLSEGDPCTLYNGKPGVCKDIHTCEWASREFQSRQITYADIAQTRCRFQGHQDIICCGDEVVSDRIRTVRPTVGFTDDDFVFDYPQTTTARSRLSTRITTVRSTTTTIRSVPTTTRRQHTIQPIRGQNSFVLTPSPVIIPQSTTIRSVPTTTRRQHTIQPIRGQNSFVLTPSSVIIPQSTSYRTPRSNLTFWDTFYPNGFDATTESSDGGLDWHSLFSDSHNSIGDGNGGSNTSSTTEGAPGSSTATGVRINLSSSKLACDFYRNIADRPITYHIFGGILADDGEFPHMAALGTLSNVAGGLKYEYDCGGSIISKDWILTAAHCFGRNEPDVIRMGTVYLNDSDIEAGNRRYMIERSVAEIQIHPEYNSNQKYNDIALIRLNQSIDFNDFHRPACLYNDLDDIPENTELLVTGWGKISIIRDLRSNTLLKTNLTGVSLTECNSSILGYNAENRAIPRGIVQTQFCAKDDNADHDACQGDSGGPLQIFDKDTRISTIVGITSFGIACGTALPSIYTRVASFLTDFIEPIVWPNGFDPNNAT